MRGRILYLISLVASITNGLSGGYAQLEGDVNGDNLVDASDYFDLRENIFDKDYAYPVSDLNKDGLFNVLDVLSMENYLHRKGRNPGKKEAFSLTSKTNISVGRVDQSERTVELLIKNTVPIGGFEIELSGTERIEEVIGGRAQNQGFKFEISGPRIAGFLEKGVSIKKGESMLVRLRISEVKIGSLCVSKAIFGNPEGGSIKVSLGNCANELFTKEGYETLTNYAAISTKPILNYDYNEDEILNVSDVQAVQNLLYREGIQPTYKKSLNSKNWIKVDFGEVDLIKKTVEVYMRNQVPVAAFEFDITGVGDIEYIGGDIDATGTKVVTTGNHIMAFSQEQSVIPEGRWLLATVSFSNQIGIDACVRRPMFVDVAGSPISGFIRQCYPLIRRVYGCTDKDALNYNPNANTDDGSCAYPQGDPRNNMAKRTWWEKLKRKFRSRKYKF